MATTNEVRNALGHLSTVEFQTSDLSNGVRVALRRGRTVLQDYPAERFRGTEQATR